METSASTPTRALDRMDVRLAAFGLASLGAVHLGFIGVEVDQAEWFIRNAGYHVMLATFALWIFSLWHLYLRRKGEGGRWWPRREQVAVAVVVVGFTVVAICQEPFQSKILNDEFVLQSTAYNMHFFREVSMMVRGYDVLGTFLSTDSYLDKRPYFYPFLITLAHDLSGYRILNAFLVNTFLLPVSLALAYHLGRSVHGWRGGMVALGLLGSLPLLVQNATGSGMELTNVTMLLATVALGAAWLAKPDPLRLSAFLLTTVLLAQSRYESVMYVLPAALLVVMGWWSRRAVILSWPAVVVPLLLVPTALHNKVLSHSPALWEMKENQTSRFGLEYVQGNLKGAIDYLFSTNTLHSNSLLLAVLGAAAIVWLPVGVVLRKAKPAGLRYHHVSWLVFAGGIFANTALVMFYFWASFADPMASRFSLPLYLLFTFAVVILVGSLDRWLPASKIALVAVGLCFLCVAIPKQANHHYSILGIDEVEWERRFVSSLPHGDRLVLTNKSTLPWLLQQTPSIMLLRANIMTDRIKHQLGEPTFKEILVLQSLRPTSVEGHHQVVPEDKLPSEYKVERLAEKRFGTKIARISRLIAIEDAKKPASE
jgi:4-amino-4-deoxy-L-arabinose transferase-like glycosyltransferase